MSKRTYKDAINALNSLQSNYNSIELKKLNNSLPKDALINEVYDCIKRLNYKPKDFNKLNLIHITGTKGKGSTCAFTESILLNYLKKSDNSNINHTINKIGLFTSPHLKTVRERIRINGNSINEPIFTKYFFEVWDKLSETTPDSNEKIASNQDNAEPSNHNESVKLPMYFKFLTILSFHVFMREGVDTAIYEVGVGGTYDSTNIIDKPTVTAITALGIDHVFMLGNTIESITWNKTGIFKKGCDAIVSNQIDYPQANKLIEERAQEIGVSSLTFVNHNLVPSHVKLGLMGDFQYQNASLAIKIATLHLKKLGFPNDNLPTFNDEGYLNDDLPDQFIKGLQNVVWPGRCQLISSDPRLNWYIDGAHTIESIKVASNWFKQTMDKKRVNVLLFNQQSRENSDELLTTLFNILSPDVKFDHAVFTTNVTWSSGDYSPDLVSMNSSKEQVEKLQIQKKLAQTWSDLESSKSPKSRKHLFHDIETSVNFIKSLSDDSEINVFVVGSLHLVGGVLVVLDE